jgi:hypothetical protein
LESPFLRLPAEIRNQVYEEALGGNGIKINYKTYQCSYKKVVPVFKYHCTVLNFSNPFTDSEPQSIRLSRSFTLLNNICRQLYLETGVLPYRLNRWAFASHKTMVNFLLMEQRLSSQQRHAITELFIFDGLPGANILTYLPNLEKVSLGSEQSSSRSQGWHRVVRRDGEEPRLEFCTGYKTST